MDENRFYFKRKFDFWCLIDGLVVVFFLNQITNKYIIIIAENKRGKSNYNLTVYRKINGTVTGTFDSFSHSI